LVDPLTRAFNRRYLEAHLPRMVARSATALKSLAILMIDIDDFKQINDKYLHINGDIVLREVVNRIMHSLRPSDLVVRLGGDEFAVIMPETDLTTALIIAERLRERIAATPVTFIGSGTSTQVTISIGGACIEHDENITVEDVLKRADSALYKAKQAGRNQVVGETEKGPREKTPREKTTGNT
jgi:two-component system cell cycle response regulator